MTSLWSLAYSVFASSHWTIGLFGSEGQPYRALLPILEAVFCMASSASWVTRSPLPIVSSVRRQHALPKSLEPSDGGNSFVLLCIQSNCPGEWRWAVRPAEIRGVSPGTPATRKLLAEIALGIHILGARLGPSLWLDYIGAAIFLGWVVSILFLLFSSFRIFQLGYIKYWGTSSTNGAIIDIFQYLTS